MFDNHTSNYQIGKYVEPSLNQNESLTEEELEKHKSEDMSFMTEQEN
jgi:hypothetical protein